VAHELHLDKAGRAIHQLVDREGMPKAVWMAVGNLCKGAKLFKHLLEHPYT
jgi:hypothetical protein